MNEVSSQKDVLGTRIEFLKGVGPNRAEALNKELGIFTFSDLLRHFPFRYVDRTKITPLKSILAEGQTVMTKGVLLRLQLITAGNRKQLTALFDDGTGRIELRWFRGHQWLLKSLREGTEYFVFGKTNFYKHLYIAHPELERITDEEKDIPTGLQPVYASTEKLGSVYLDSKGISRLQKTLLSQLKPEMFPEFFPPWISKKYRLTARFDTLVNVHFPKNEAQLNLALSRLRFEELFLMQLRTEVLRQQRYAASNGYVLKNIDGWFDRFYKECLPFELTGAQKKVLKEIRKDVLSGRQMNRLLQGDVGSGKTIVALMTMLMAVDNGFQACLMAPTEILAQQHYRVMQKLLGHLDLKMELLTGSVKGKQRNEILQRLADGEIHIIAGTHALIEPKVTFSKLGIAVIDEQHRFGVEQRAALRSKSPRPPHVLVMTATPIPRTLAMTVYGDLDVSVIDELPPGRKNVITVHRTDSDRLKVFGFLKEEIRKGRQIYIVYPLIDESEKQDYKDLMDGYESISRAFPLPAFRTGVLHGRMKAEDKDYEMKRFAKGETDILVSTTVIEVGVDVPNATVMVIESAERFGLAQLHQLRGRVGRGAGQSYCILMTHLNLSADGLKRIQALCSTNDGFAIAETDLQLRGPGDREGTRQSGALSLKLADLVRDAKMLHEARETAAAVLETDPFLLNEENRGLKRMIEKAGQNKTGWSEIS